MIPVTAISERWDRTTTTMSRITGATLALAALHGAYASPSSTSPFLGPRQQMPNLAPIHTPQPTKLINDSYIVMLKPSIDAQGMFTHLSFLEGAHAEDPLNGEDDGLRHVYDTSTTKGYAGSFSQATIDRIRAQPEVDYIEQDQIVWAFEAQTQKNAPWVSAQFSYHIVQCMPSCVAREQQNGCFGRTRRYATRLALAPD